MTTIITILIILFAVFKAAADTIAHHGGGKLKQLFGSFFDINSQGKLIPFTKYPFDGWHLCNSCMILCFILTVSLAVPKPMWITFPVASVLVIVVFNVFWNKIFK